MRKNGNARCSNGREGGILNVNGIYNKRISKSFVMNFVKCKQGIYLLQTISFRFINYGKKF